MAVAKSRTRPSQAIKNEADDRAGDRNDDRRVDHGTYHAAFEGLGLFLEFRQALKDHLQGTAGLAGLDHVDVKLIETLRALAHRLGQGASRFDVVDDVHQRIAQHARLRLAFEDAQAPQNWKPRVLQGRELPRKGRKLLVRDLADGKGLASFLRRPSRAGLSGPVPPRSD